MTENLLNWLLGVVETHPDGLDAQTVAVGKTRLERAVGELFKAKLEAEEWRRASMVGKAQALGQTTTTVSTGKLYYGGASNTAGGGTLRVEANKPLASSLAQELDRAAYNALTGK